MGYEGDPRAEWLTLRRRLGEGAYGVVYEAYDARRDAVVALKTLRAVDAESLYRLKQEFRTMADVVHPNLATLYDLVAEGTSWFITMELVDGVDLLSYLRVRPDQAELRVVFAQLAEAVAALHDAAILHRDLKPSNVLVTRDARVVVLDFGLAASLVRAPQDAGNTLTGTLVYMAPEQASGGTVTEASDWYSVGMMLYEALGGHALLEGSAGEILQRKLRFDPVQGGVLVPGAPADLDALCADLLRRDSGARPMARAILARLRGASSGPPSAGAGLSRWVAAPVDRVHELAALWDAFRAMRAGNLVICHLRGRSGIGKSRLAQHFLGEIGRGVTAAVPLAGRCYEQESVPYKALDSLIDDLAGFLRELPREETATLVPTGAGVLSRLFPVLSAAVPAAESSLHTVDTQQLRRQAAGVLRELFARLATARPLVLFIDDLQWGDIDSGALLRELLGPPNPPPLLLLVAYRAEDAADSVLLERLRVWRESGALAGEERTIELGELGPDDTRVLAQSLVGVGVADAAERVEAIARAAAGNPLFVGELVQFTEGQSPHLQPEVSLEEVIRARVATLPASARRILEIVAVAGQPLRLDVARRAAGLASERDPLFGMLRSLHLMRTRSADGHGAAETFHDRIREAVVGALTTETRRLRHRELADAWETAGGADPETLAVHLEGAGESARAATYCTRAAEQASAALAFDRAARLYERALDLHPVGPVAARELRARLAAALANAGRGAAAGRAYLLAAAAAEPDSALELRRCAAEQFLVSGHITEGMDALQQVLAMVDEPLARSPRRALASLVLRQLLLRARGLRFRSRDTSEVPAEVLARIDACWSASIGLSLVDSLRGADFVARHLWLALRAGEPYRVARGLALQLGGSVMRGRRGAWQTRRLQRLTWTIARRVAHPHALALAATNTAAVLSFQGRFGASLKMGRRAEAILRERCTGVRWELDTILIFRLHSFGWMGRWRQLAAALPAVLREADQRDDLYLTTYVRVRVSHLLHLAADRPDRARRSQQEGIAAWSPARFQVQHYWDWLACIEIDLYEASPGAAWARLVEGWRELRRSALSSVQAIFIESRWLRMRAVLAHASCTATPRSDLLRLVARDATSITRQGTAWGDALATLGRAALAACAGERSRAAQLADDAEGRFLRLDMHLYAAAARRRRGELIGGAQGNVLIASADAVFAAEDSADPSRLANMLAPGRWR